MRKSRCLHAKIQGLEQGSSASFATLEQTCQQRISQLDDDRGSCAEATSAANSCPRSINSGLKPIARLTWVNEKGETALFLSDDEVMNLKSPRHAGPTKSGRPSTITSSPPSRCWKPCRGPTPQARAGVCRRPPRTHDGKGYPKGLIREQMSTQARTMAICRHLRSTHRMRPPHTGKAKKP